MITYGELFAGYGGLGMGVQSVLGGEMAWCAEYDAAPSKILAHHWPTAPNLGDVTKVDWTTVPRVDVITGGSPCQDLSLAGRRAGMRPGTRSGLWSSMCQAIDTLRPSLVVWENVRGALSAEAASGLEPCPGCVGDRDDGPVLRALGRVLGDLADLGYDARWYGLRAADMGAPHGRFRVFVFATPADAEGDEQRESLVSVGQRAEPWRGDICAPTDAQGDGRAAWITGRRRTSFAGTAGDQLPTSDTIQLRRDRRGQRPARTAIVWPSREARGLGEGVSPTAYTTRVGWDEVRAEPAGLVGGSHAPERSDAPTAHPDSDSVRVEPVAESGRSREAITGRVGDVAWGQYEPAIARWEAVLGRPAPAPTEVGPKCGARLSARFTEWLMGLPDGHVTDVPGLSRNDQLKALGNGVVPAQCAAATRAWLADVKAERAAS